MTQRDDQVLLRDMLEAARAALAAVGGQEFVALEKDPIRTLGLIKCLEIVGEAATRLSAELKTRHAAIPWAAIVGMRNRLVHVYLDVDYKQVWKTLVEDLPPLVKQLEAVLANELDGS